MSRVLVTGASGFIGNRLCQLLAANGKKVRLATRTTNSTLLPKIASELAMVGEIDSKTSWSQALENIDTVVHLAARVHIMNDSAKNPLDEFRRVNVAGTCNLARQAADLGVKRLIFLSSIKVNGEKTRLGHPFTEQDQAAPEGPYSISKYEAEEGLWQLAADVGLEVTIIRPPLVYGPGVKANLQKMIYWVNTGIPLPLGAVDNRRSLIALDNLVDFILTCINNRTAANQLFLVADGHDISTTHLLQLIGEGLAKPARLIPVPQSLLLLGASLLGKKSMAQRLCGSLQVDISKARRLLGWQPPLNPDQALRRVLEGFGR